MMKETKIFAVVVATQGAVGVHGKMFVGSNPQLDEQVAAEGFGHFYNLWNSGSVPQKKIQERIAKTRAVLDESRKPMTKDVNAIRRDLIDLCKKNLEDSKTYADYNKAKAMCKLTTKSIRIAHEMADYIWEEVNNRKTEMKELKKYYSEDHSTSVKEGLAKLGESVNKLEEKKFRVDAVVAFNKAIDAKHKTLVKAFAGFPDQVEKASTKQSQLKGALESSLETGMKLLKKTLASNGTESTVSQIEKKAAWIKKEVANANNEVKDLIKSALKDLIELEAEIQTGLNTVENYAEELNKLNEFSVQGLQTWEDEFQSEATKISMAEDVSKLDNKSFVDFFPIVEAIQKTREAMEAPLKNWVVRELLERAKEAEKK